jgi:hypothetical protein
LDPSQPPAPIATGEEDTFSLAFPSTQHLIVFRANAMDIADKVLADSGVKLHASRKFVGTAWDYKAYAQGKEDSKKIDMRGKRIKDVNDSEDESAPRKRVKKGK